MIIIYTIRAEQQQKREEGGGGRGGTTKEEGECRRLMRTAGLVLSILLCAGEYSITYEEEIREEKDGRKGGTGRGRSSRQQTVSRTESKHRTITAWNEQP